MGVSLRLSWIAVVLCSMGFVCGCGGDEQPTATKDADRQVAARSSVTAANDDMAKSDAPMLTAPAGGEAEFETTRDAFVEMPQATGGRFFEPPAAPNLPARSELPESGAIAGLGGNGPQGRERADGEDLRGQAERLSNSDTAPGEPASEASTLEEDGKSKQSARKPTSGKTWKPAQVIPNSSRLTVGENDELPFKGQQASVRIDGFRARVVLDMFYENNRDQQLEGTFQIRLPEGASLYYLAFGETEYVAKNSPVPQAAFLKAEDTLSRSLSPNDITDLRQQSWNEPKVARVVPKEKAAHAYRQTVRRRIDPALAEWSGAGVFSARVFPLAARKVHRIVIGYDVNVLNVGNDRVYRLDLPKAETTVVDINVSDPNSAENNLQDTNKNVQASPQASRVIQRDGRVLFHYENPDEHSLVIRLAGQPNVWLTSADDAAGPFVAGRFLPDFDSLPSSVAGAAVAQRATTDRNNEPSHAVFLLDTSLSSNPNRFPAWLKLLKANLEENRDQIRHFAVACFNIETHWWKPAWVENTPENVAELMEYCDNLALEGATDLGRALRTACAGPVATSAQEFPDFDLFLLSDGAGTWGESDLHALSQALGNRTLFAYSTGMAGTDTRMLNHLARESAGAVFAVTGADQVAAAATAHRRRPWQIETVKIAGVDDILLAGRPTAIFPGQTLTLAGRGELAKDSVVELTVSQGKTVKTLQLSADQQLESELAARTYGAIAVDQLEGLTDATEEFSAAYARHFRVPGKTCSLLMLESEEDYQRYNIKPEADLVVVAERDVRTIVDDVLEAAAEQFGDPKVAFLNWLNRLERMPGVEYETPAALKIVLEKLPKQSFSVSATTLVCKNRDWTGISGPLQEQLPSQKLDYDTLAAEANWRLKSAGPADALRAMSSLVEVKPGDATTARDVGFTAMEYGLGAEAYSLFRRVAVSRPWEPQTYHAIARCLEDMEKADLAVAYYEVALAGNWDSRFGAFREIVSRDYLRLLRRIDRDELSSAVSPVFLRTALNRLEKSPAGGEQDLVVTIMWNTDGTDVDLHVLEPTGETCFYSHPKTKIGGQITQDVTQGYGPEMYQLTNAPAGRYRIWAKYFADDSNRTGTRTRVYATVYRNWGRPHESVQRTALTLKGNKQEHDIATLTLK